MPTHRTTLTNYDNVIHAGFISPGESISASRSSSSKLRGIVLSTIIDIGSGLHEDKITIREATQT